MGTKIGPQRAPRVGIRMFWDFFQWRSIKTRVTVFALAIFVVGIWALAFYASRMLFEDTQRQLSEQQFSTASFIADEIDHEVNDRLKALETMAARVSPGMLANPTALQAYLEDPPFLQHLFNNGVLVVGLDGTTIADVPREAGRLGVNYMNRDFIVAALKEGKTTISAPVVGKALKGPLIGMVVPIRNAQGRVIGAIDGVIALGEPNFLDRVRQGGYGKSGYYNLVAAKHRLIVTSSDKRRIMERLPAPGVSSAIDRSIGGYEGSTVFVNAIGTEVLISTKQIPAADWFVVVSLPTAEAFAPIRGMQQNVLLAAILLTLLVGGLTWWTIRRELSPLFAVVEHLIHLSYSTRP